MGRLLGQLIDWLIAWLIAWLIDWLCFRESFYQRSLPFAAAGALLTHLAVKQGYLRASPKYGSLPKVMGIAVAGFMLGKMSYFGKCQEKFLRLPDSRVADAIRKRNGQSGPVRGQSPQSNWNQPLSQPVDSGRVYEPVSAPPSRFDPQVGQSRSRGETFSAMNTDDYHNTLDIDSEKNTYYDDSSLDERRVTIVTMMKTVTIVTIKIFFLIFRCCLNWSEGISGTRHWLVFADA